MNERELILKFLNRYYRIELGKFYDILFDKNIYGCDILEHLIVIHSIDENISKIILTEWALTNMTSEDFEKNWKKINPTNISPNYELKKMNRYLITFPEYIDIPKWVSSECSRPSMKLTTKKIFGFKYSSKIAWDDMVIKLKDPIGPSTSQSLMELIYFDLNKKQKIKDKFTYNIEMLDPTGHVVERWSLSDCKIKSIDFGKLSHQSDEAVTCTIVIKLGKVILEY